jgi:ribosomal protein S1
MEMNVTKLKLKVKEVKVEARKLTVEEWAVYLLSENKNSIYQHDAKEIVKSWGLVEFVNGLIGLFRTVTIRDATPKEVIAWHCLESYKECDRVDDTCYACPLNVTGGICIPRKCEERSKKY